MALSARISSSSSEAIDREIVAIKALLKRELSDEEYHRFLYCLIGIGKMVADSAGDDKKGGLGRKKPEAGMSPEEAESLGVLAAKFGLDVEAGRAAVERL